MFQKKVLIIVIVCLVIKLALHLLADAHSGFQGDELLHIESGHHPAAGYMEFPPLIGWVAWIQNLPGSDSVWVHHLFTHLAALLILVLTALVTMELGGGALAVFTVLLCLLVAPAFGRTHQLFQPTVFSQLFWLLSFYQLVRFVKTLDARYLLWLSISAAAGSLSKYDFLFFIAGLTSLFFFQRTRQALLKRSTLGYIALFLLLISPNIIWQVRHQFPVWQHMSRLYESQLNHVEAGNVVHDLLLHLNPLTAIIWLAGAFFIFSPNNKDVYRPVGIAVLISLACLALSKSKAYYFFPAMITLMAFGSVWLEAKVLSWRKWLLYLVCLLLVLSGIILVPYAMPVLSLDRYIQFTRLKKEEGRYPIAFSEFYSETLWQHTLTAIQSVYQALTEKEKKDCLIWGKHYRQAGAIALYGRHYGLPNAFSYHGSFYLWAPEGQMPETIIAFSNGEAGIDFFQNYFASVVVKARVYNAYADDAKDVWQTIYVCKLPKQTFTDLKEIFRTRVYE